jgi:Tfp pilus assembly protein PilN
MTTLTASRVAEFPRVNLLPPEIDQASRLRRLQILLGLALLGLLVIVALVFFWAGGQVTAANDELTAAEAQGASLEAQVADFAEVPKVIAEVGAAQDALVTAMTPEVRFSFYLNDLSLTIPRSTRLVDLTATNTAAAAQLDPSLPPTATQLGEPTMGNIAFTGASSSFDGVAAWMQSLARQEGYVSPTLQTVAKADADLTVGTVYTVSSSTSLSIEAASGRFERVMESE